MLSIEKRGGVRNDIVIMWDGEAIFELSACNLEAAPKGQHVTLDYLVPRIKEAWIDGRGLHPTAKQMIFAVGAVRCLTRWYDGGLILVDGTYVYGDDHIVSV